jgi:serine/threonine-protein kinase
MALTIGSQLGSHEIIALLGKGGMGEVYRARDLKLKREVAIKILPEEFSRDADRVSRFQREAEVLASLNHPNIAAIYDLQEANETRFLVLELVDGETLAERIRRAPMPVEEVLDVAMRISEALEAAHEKGIVHRDLKPANVKVTAEGKVKVLDFGLAKALENAPTNPGLSNSPTLSLAATKAGVILGTAAYMSPEQAKGVEADLRSDVFSFGCVLYEMLCRRQAFQGESVSEILAAVLIRDADFNALPPDLSPRIPDLLRRCLEKNPRNRWHAVADLRAELESIAKSPRVASTLTAISAPRRSLLRRALPSLAIAAILSAASGLFVWKLKPSHPGPVIRFAISLPDEQVFGGVARQFLAISPDGTKLAYIANNQLFLRHMGEMEARPITASINLNSPFFSPDSQWLGFYSIPESAIKKVAITGGLPTTVTKAGPPFGISWGGAVKLFLQNAVKESCVSLRLEVNRNSSFQYKTRTPTVPNLSTKAAPFCLLWLRQPAASIVGSKPTSWSNHWHQSIARSSSEEDLTRVTSQADTLCIRSAPI